ncbi:MAG: hypothetical protein H7062_21610 [Candidatus Saccharimonas sp.]|nr:hypothetical protein [Planctomycetaceae bacterium]
MSTAQLESRLLDEVAEFLASQPTREQLLAFRPSAAAVERAADLLARGNAGTLTFDDELELRQFESTELLMRSLKARLR